jgi:hypothetical protein
MNKTLAAALALALVSIFALPSQALAVDAPASVAVTSTSTLNTASDQATVRVSWPAVTGAEAYSVSGTASGQASGESSIYSCLQGTCSVTVAGLVGGVSYSFVVTAFLNADEASSTPVRFTAKSIPAGPVPLAPTVSGGAVNLSWASPTNTGGLPLSGYTIEVRTGVTLLRSQDVGPGASTASLAGLAAGQRYNITIRSKNSLGSSEAVPFDSVTLASAPSAPTSVTASVSGQTSVRVAWTAPSDNGSPIDFYKVYLVNPATNLDVGAFTRAEGTSVVIPGLANGSYVAEVVATNAQGDGTRSSSSNTVLIGAGSLANIPVISPSSLSSLGVGQTVSVSASSPSGGNVTLSVSASPAGACTLVSGVLRGVSLGTCTLTANAPATTSYSEGSSSRIIAIKQAQTINFTAIPGQNMPGPLTIFASASSNLPVQFSASGSCSVDQTQVTFIAPGGCSITATQPGNSEYAAAPTITRSFVISAGSSGGAFGNPNLAQPGEGLPAPKASKVFTTKKVGPAKAVVLTKPTTRVSIRVGEAVRVRLTGLTEGARVSSVLRTKAGFEYFLSAAIVKANGKYRTPAVQPRKAGVYRIVTTIGTEKKTLRIRVR